MCIQASSENQPNGLRKEWWKDSMPLTCSPSEESGSERKSDHKHQIAVLENDGWDFDQRSNAKDTKAQEIAKKR